MVQWNEYYWKYQLQPDSNIKAIKRRTILFLLVLASTLIMELVTPFGAFAGDIKTVQAAPFHTDCATGICSPIGNVIIITSSFVSIPVLTLFTSFIILITINLRHDYKAIHNDLKVSISDQSLDLEAIRQRHMDLGKLVKAADKIFSLGILVCLMWCIFVTSTSIYLLLVGNLHPIDRNILICALVFCLLPMMLLVAVGTSLNEKVRQIIDNKPYLRPFILFCNAGIFHC